jgi:ABC-type microcin C transport system duplicated ATPase subunit YejF
VFPTREFFKEGVGSGPRNLQGGTFSITCLLLKSHVFIAKQLLSSVVAVMAKGRVGRPASKRQRCLDDFGSVQDKQRRKLKADSADIPKCDDASISVETRGASALEQPSTVCVTCRSEETAKLTKTIGDSLQSQQGIAIYVPGQPGTGKTHTVRAVLETLPCSQWRVPSPALALINCTDRQRCTLGRIIVAGVYDSVARRTENCSVSGMLSKLTPFK